MDKNQSRASTASSVSTSSAPRKSNISRRKQSKVNKVSKTSSRRRTRFSTESHKQSISSESSETNSPKVSVARIKYSYTSVGSNEFSRQESRASLTQQKYSFSSWESPVSTHDANDMSAGRRPSMAKRVSTLMGTGSSVHNTRASTAPRRSVAFFQEGEINDLPRRSMVGTSRIQIAIERQSTVSRLSKPPTVYVPTSEPDSALDHDKEELWIYEKGRLRTMASLGPEEPEFNLFGRDKPCCKNRRDPQGAVGPNVTNMAGTDLGYQQKIKSLASHPDKRKFTSSIEQLEYGSIGKGCPSEYCKNKSLPDWVDGHGNLDNIQSENSQYASVDYTDYDNDSPLSQNSYIQAYNEPRIASPSSSRRGIESSRYSHQGSHVKGSMYSRDSSGMGSRGESTIRADSLISEDSKDYGTDRMASKDVSKSSKELSFVTSSVNKTSRGQSKESFYDSMTSKDDSMALEYKSTKHGNQSSTSGSKSFKTESKAGSIRSERGSKISERGSKSSRRGTTSSRGKSNASEGNISSKFKSRSSQTEDRDN